MFRDVRGRRRCLPRSADGHRGREAQNRGRMRLEDGERDRGRENGSRRTRFSARRLCTAVVGRGLCDLRPGYAVLVMMKRARAVLAALHACFGRRLPSGTERHGALRKGKHADDRRDSSQNRPHVSRMRYHWHSVNARSGPSRPPIAHCSQRNSAPSARLYIWMRRRRSCACAYNARSAGSRRGSVAAGTSKTSCVTCRPHSDASAPDRSRSWPVCSGGNPSRRARQTTAATRPMSSHRRPRSSAFAGRLPTKDESPLSHELPDSRRRSL